jgi:KamA family protein
LKECSASCRLASGVRTVRPAGRAFRVYTQRDLARIPQLAALPEIERRAMAAVANVFPFRVNSYVVDELIDWSNVPDDPIFQLTFPQPGMLEAADLQRMLALSDTGAPRSAVSVAAREIQLAMNPHPAGQLELNVPLLDGKPVSGVQHKYRETILFFPASGQTCHAYCSYCFRWPQFVGLENLKFASRGPESLITYLRRHPEVTSVLITGGDPMVMKTAVLRRYVEPILEANLEHVASIRIGTKSPAYWPQRYVSDADADDLLALFEEVCAAGKHLALMAHYSHPRELETAMAEQAVHRIRSTGATIRCQAPLIKHVNDAPEAWAAMWRKQVRLGAVPYYMFVERDTGPQHYFEVPLARGLEIFAEAYNSVSGLGRTVRGPSMSTSAGKILVDGIVEFHGEDLFVLQFLQARDPDWVGRPFFARFDPKATWIDDLRPPLGESEFCFDTTLRQRENAPEQSR